MTLEDEGDTCIGPTTSNIDFPNECTTSCSLDEVADAPCTTLETSDVIIAVDMEANCHVLPIVNSDVPVTIIQDGEGGGAMTDEERNAVGVDNGTCNTMFMPTKDSGSIVGALEHDSVSIALEESGVVMEGSGVEAPLQESDVEATRVCSTTVVLERSSMEQAETECGINAENDNDTLAVLEETTSACAHSIDAENDASVIMELVKDDTVEEVDIVKEAKVDISTNPPENAMSCSDDGGIATAVAATQLDAVSNEPACQEVDDTAENSTRISNTEHGSFYEVQTPPFERPQCEDKSKFESDSKVPCETSGPCPDTIVVAEALGESDWAIDDHITAVCMDRPATHLDQQLNNEQCVAMTNATTLSTSSDLEDEGELEGVMGRDTVVLEDARTNDAVIIPVDEKGHKHTDIDPDIENSLPENAKSHVNNMQSILEIGDVANNRELSGEVQEEEQDEQHQKKLEDKNFGDELEVPVELIMDAPEEVTEERTPEWDSIDDEIIEARIADAVEVTCSTTEGDDTEEEEGHENEEEEDEGAKDAQGQEEEQEDDELEEEEDELEKVLGEEEDQEEDLDDEEDQEEEQEEEEQEEEQEGDQEEESDEEEEHMEQEFALKRDHEKEKAQNEDEGADVHEDREERNRNDDKDLEDDEDDDEDEDEDDDEDDDDDDDDDEDDDDDDDDDDDEDDDDDDDDDDNDVEEDEEDEEDEEEEEEEDENDENNLDEDEAVNEQGEEDDDEEEDEGEEEEEEQHVGNHFETYFPSRVNTRWRPRTWVSSSRTWHVRDSTTTSEGPAEKINSGPRTWASAARMPEIVANRQDLIVQEGLPGKVFGASSAVHCLPRTWASTARAPQAMASRPNTASRDRYQFKRTWASTGRVPQTAITRSGSQPAPFRPGLRHRSGSEERPVQRPVVSTPKPVWTPSIPAPLPREGRILPMGLCF